MTTSNYLKALTISLTIGLLTACGGGAVVVTAPLRIIQRYQ